jgi:hypothetical protein
VTSDKSEHIGPSFPVKSGKPWHLTHDQHQALMAAHPHRDVDGELMKAALWCEANPAKRKTATGMLRFLNGWLGRAEPSGDEPAASASLLPRYDPTADDAPLIDPAGPRWKLP